MNKTNHHSIVWGRLAAFDSLKPGQTLVHFLEQHSFEVRLYDERKLQRFWFLARPVAGICVQVPEENIPAVRDFLAAQPESQELLRSAIRCPSCKSTRVHYPQMTRKNVLPTLVAHALVTLGLLRHECYCEDCQFTWVRGTPAVAKTKGDGSASKRPNVPLFGTRKSKPGAKPL
ncbi:MAG: hypothetical protein QOF48_2574 [Verrucomicrobiota bacterium]|jgi:hypothetical protein